eukprot:gene10618-12293_t
MPVSQEKLRDILERENAKKGPMGYRAPAQLREFGPGHTKAAPTADYGPSLTSSIPWLPREPTSVAYRHPCSPQSQNAVRATVPLLYLEKQSELRVSLSVQA